MASSSSSVHNKTYVYDVFLSFSGEDTRKTFVDHLYAALDQQGICTFKDEERLEKGKKINDELLQSIEDSRCYIIVFSKHYASSSWCLNELLKIMECHKTGEHIAFPVFYDVDPSEVRKQTGSVGEGLVEHTNKNESEVGKWRDALEEAANLCGWDVRKTANGHEAKVIKIIVEQVSLELRPGDIGVDENLLGMEQRMKDLDPCLEIGKEDVRMIGIKGMGGAGKTTLAWAIFNKISINFEGKTFIENVRERASHLGLEKLQEQVLTDVLMDKYINIRGVNEGKSLMRKKLRGIKVLLVLDDVDHKYQLEMLAGDITWFMPGSRIIITTRDEQVLEAHRVKFVCNVNFLSYKEAICLFSRHAFGKDSPPQGYERHSHRVARYAAGLPLTIKVLGSYLCGKDQSEWTNALERLKTIPLKETLQILELSYENLEDDYKQIFLDVACFLRGWDRVSAIRMLESCGYYARNGLRVLEQRSLITTSDGSDGGRIDMHDRIQEMGKNIVRREHPDEPKRHSRLWVREEINHIFVNDLVTEETRCIKVVTTPGIILEGLKNMKKLRCLIVNFSYGHVKIDEARHYFPNSLQYIHWSNYPHWCLPKTFEADNLVTLEICGGEIKQLWEGGKVKKKLKSLYLGSTLLRSLDLTLTPNLKNLHLAICPNLVEIRVHDGCLKGLVHLNLHGCTSLRSYLFIQQAEALKVLHIDGLDLRESPDFIIKGPSNSLLELHISNTHMKQELSSIGNLRKLVSLELINCFGLRSLPRSICSLQHLRTLKLRLTAIEELPEDLGRLECLENLELTSIHVKRLPGSIFMLKRLKTLVLKNHDYLAKLPEDIGQLECLVTLDLGGCYNLRCIPNNICQLKRLKELKLTSCKRLKKLPDGLGDLECLKELHIQSTRISGLPGSISLLKGLKIYRSEWDDLLLDNEVNDDFGYYESKEELVEVSEALVQ